MRFIERIGAWTGGGALAVALVMIPGVAAEASHAQAGGASHVVAAAQVAAAPSVIVMGDGPGSNHRRSRGGSGLISRHLGR
jgi:hypothetical protein